MNEFNKPYEFIRDNYYGDGGYTNCTNDSYLIRFPRESKEFYNDRIKNSNLTNLFRPLQDLFLEPIFSQSLKLQTQNTDLNFLVENTKLFMRGNKSLLSFKLNDNALFSVSTDVSNDGTPDTTIIPDIKDVSPTNLIGLKMNGLMVSSAEYNEYEQIDKIKIPVLVEYSGNVFAKKTMAWRENANKITLTDLGEAKRIKDFDVYQYGVLNMVGVGFGDLPRSFDLGRIQKELFQLDSQRKGTLRKDGHPILMIQTNSELKQMSLSKDTILKIPVNEEIKHAPQYLEAGLEGVELITQIMDETKSTIYKVWTNGLFSDNIKYANVFTSLIAKESFTNHVDSLYIIYQEIINTMVENIKFIYGLNTTYTIDFPAISFSEEEAKEKAQDILN